jgi:hypothetical protein
MFNFLFKKLQDMGTKKMILSVSDQEEFRRADIVFCLLKIGSHVCRGGGRMWD